MKKALGGVVALVVLMVLVLVMGIGGSITGGISGTLGSRGDDTDSEAGDSSAANIPAQYQGDITRATQQCSDLRASLLAAQIWQESKWNPHAESPGVGAQGIAQFMPATWSTWGRDGDGDGKKDVWNPHDAILAQGAFMCDLYKTIKADMSAHRITRGSLDQNVLAAYNGGPGLPEGTGGFPTGVAQSDQYAPAILQKEADYKGSGGGQGCGDHCPPVSGPFSQKIVAVLKQTVGIRYVFGGGTPQGPSNGGYDCSGLSLYAMYRATDGKVSLPHSAAMQHSDSRFKVIASGGAHTQAVKDAAKKAQPGDLLTFNVPTDPAPWGHVGIAIGNGRMIHAPNPSKTVEEVPIYDIYEMQVSRLSDQK